MEASSIRPDLRSCRGSRPTASTSDTGESGTGRTSSFRIRCCSGGALAEEGVAVARPRPAGAWAVLAALRSAALRRTRGSSADATPGSHAGSKLGRMIRCTWWPEPPTDRGPIRAGHRCCCCSSWRSGFTFGAATCLK